MKKATIMAASTVGLSAQIHAITTGEGVERDLMRNFADNGTTLANQAIEALANDLVPSAYPNLPAMLARATEGFDKCAIAAINELFNTYGRTVPAAFYNVLLTAAFKAEGSEMYRMFQKAENLMEDRLNDAVLHAMLLVTPIGLHVQSVLSGYGLELMHVMNCGCSLRPTARKPFDAPIDSDELPALTENLMAAALEQYGVNAVSSGGKRGF